MIVLADADIEAAARWGVWGVFSNSGQTCMSPERVYVVEAVYEPFIQAVQKEIQTLKVGYSFEPESNNHYGSMTFPRQLNIVTDQLEDALQKGANQLTGGSHQDLFFEPTLLTNITDEMLVMQEETFGPLMPVIKVKDEEEAIRLANDSPFGLSASVFGEDLTRAKRVAESLEVGTVNINDTLSHYGLPELPFGGVKQSGNGRSNGKAGLLEFTQPIGYVSGKPKTLDIATIIRDPGNYHFAKGAMLALLAPTFKQKWAGVKALFKK
jgi:succinate-semialdehyde dehydrogenase/glutarate-semialdehyde dehydrogenase